MNMDVESTLPATLLVSSALTLTLLRFGSAVLQTVRSRSWSNWKKTVLLKVCGPCFGRRFCGPVEDEDAVCGICHCPFGLFTPLQCSVCSFAFHRCCIESWQKTCQASNDVQKNNVHLGPNTVSCPACRTLVSIKGTSLGERVCSCFFPVSTS